MLPTLGPLMFLQIIGGGALAGWEVYQLLVEIDEDHRAIHR